VKRQLGGGDLEEIIFDDKVRDQPDTSAIFLPSCFNQIFSFL
jgi:hypothetical protein